MESFVNDPVESNEHGQASTAARLWSVLLTAALLLGAGAARAAEPTGAELFAKHCATCHGPEGEGGGPAASAMKVAPPNLRTLAKRSGGTFPHDAIAAYIDGREQVASHGDRLMPVWGDFLQRPEDKGSEAPVRARIEALVAFIELLQYR
ncbi:MAG TPA: c-type cytochrome [Gammaproteobacteria bacterium]|jgi:mono/diheme cytochrome c family protein|nr:c-type cytochrome [Gammaproteobacteria bacterium]